MSNTNGYPKGAVHDADIAAEDADPELHHHEVSHSHPFTDLEHQHDVGDLPEIEEGGHDEQP